MGGQHWVGGPASCRIWPSTHQCVIKLVVADSAAADAACNVRLLPSLALRQMSVCSAEEAAMDGIGGE